MNSLRGFLSWDEDCAEHIQSFQGQMDQPEFDPAKAITELHRDGQGSVGANPPRRRYQGDRSSILELTFGAAQTSGAMRPRW